MAKIIRGLHNIKAAHLGGVATIGNFDGVHLGHQAIVKQLAMQAKLRRVPSMIITFEPPPSNFLNLQRAPARITSFRDKVQVLKNLPIDWLLVLHFNHQLATLSAQAFVQKVIIEKLKVCYLAVGQDFRFGYQRQGDLNLLEKIGRRYRFDVICTATLTVDNQRVSSTQIRQALAKADLEKVKKSLGRIYQISGRVRHGQQLGRTLGYPTANIALPQGNPPLKGVFTVTVTGLSEHPLPAIANIGIRPTLNNSQPLLEVHIFDFNQNIYGQHIQVTFLQQIREEVKFCSLTELQVQINKDCEAARKLFLLYNV
ncbi:bifunctional riboflavin kinase/FAD synthetase [Candidatus Nitrosacidococcus sp. I8]|uniref:bifunctional riboflavin kinase/FAD synthetase n=1 Tax=Candidatus Nitrosacidococcus sp. I8 TaxID=2942908 RepID=UPI0022265AD6|nr:bifunctional riboflavin kinase/FAD synthetase [Candidatus Nitrosacidococcus sp. I8]CAH9017497.1 Bifunctional riboflavin kinase/FMN adenylyltransferase [Candidatus Nitrosacidococcus sp. I8]